jgi:signal transduction histidine kinase
MSSTLRKTLEQAEPNLHQILSHIADGVLLVDKAGTVVYANPAAESIFGYESGRMEGCMLGYPVIEGMAEVEIPQADGMTAVAEFRSVEITWQGKPVYLASFRDITQRKRAERRVATLSRELVTAYERAQREIGHELHDGVGQLLLGIRLSIDGVKRAHGTDATAGMDKLGGMVDEVIEELRRLSHALKPAVLDDFTFLDALQSHVERLRDESGLDVTLRHDGVADRNNDMVETVAFRIVQEALTNVLRHADTDRADVEVYEQAGALHLRIADDGRGFDTDAQDPAHQQDAAIGLKGMSERAELIGGTFSIDSTPGRGTVITASLPLDQQT